MRSRAGHPLRSDAARNRDALIEATIETLTRRPQASVTEIAVAAGVSRATVYGHFASREHLVSAAVRKIKGRLDERLARNNPAFPPAEDLDDLVATSWWALGQMAGMTAAARWGADPSDVQPLLDDTRARIQELIMRGRAAGRFRSDQSLEWQTTCFSALLQARASEVRGGPPSSEAGAELVATMRALLAAAP